MKPEFIKRSLKEFIIDLILPLNKKTGIIDARLESTV
jgi:hypothetical protein